MGTVYVGGDVSKGYIDVHVADSSGKKLRQKQLVDVPDGHRTFRDMVTSLAGKDGQVIFAVEATGSYERNWLATACQLRQATGGRVKVYRLNPLSVKRYLDAELHRNVTDKASAAGICAYLRTQDLGREYEGTGDEGIRALYRLACDAVHQTVTLKTQLLMLLSSTAPELVRYTREEVPDWLLTLLSRYGTAVELAQALPADVQPCVGGAVKASTLIEAAKTSVASLTDGAAALAVKHLVAQLLDAQLRAEQRKEIVVSLVADRAEFVRVVSIKGIGRWTAAVLLLELGSFDRFPTAETVTAFAGLDPRIHQSGDAEWRKRISKKGSPRIRAALYMPAWSAVRYNPVIRAFYQRLVEDNGKEPQVAIVAVMRKLLILAWACGRQSGKPFSVTYEADRQAERPLSATEPLVAPKKPAAKPSAPNTPFTAAAPVSRRTLRRIRKQRAGSTPQNAV